MAFRDVIFINDTVSKRYDFMVVGPCWSRFGPIFFGSQIVHFCSVLEILSFIFNFLLSSTTVLYEDSDSEHESFQKISGKKSERSSGLTHGDENRDFYEKSRFCLNSMESILSP